MRRAVSVEWEGPLTVPEVLTRRGDDDAGLYQIYGRHVVFGPNALLYVGMTVRQTFGARFEQHTLWLQGEDEVHVRLGRIPAGLENAGYSDDADWSRLVADVEALTIFWHSPPYNSRNIGTYRGADITVQTWGRRGSLLPEYSATWARHRRRPEE